MTLEVAARHAGIDDETLRKWRRSDRSLEEDIEAAYATYEVRLAALASRHATTGRVDPLKVLAANARTRERWAGGPSRVVVDGGEPLRIEAKAEVEVVVDSATRLRDLAATLDVLARIGVLPAPDGTGGPVPIRNITPVGATETIEHETRKEQP